MKKLHGFLFATAITMVLSAPAFAQEASQLNAGSETQRDVNQQNRIEQGLKSGDLSTKEAAQLEKGESRIDQTEAKDMKDGVLSPREKEQIQREQNHESALIKKDDTNNIKG